MGAFLTWKLCRTNELNFFLHWCQKRCFPLLQYLNWCFYSCDESPFVCEMIPSRDFYSSYKLMWAINFSDALISDTNHNPTWKLSFSWLFLLLVFGVTFRPHVHPFVHCFRVGFFFFPGDFHVLIVIYS